jgi:molybdopterin molybdotransferase
MIVSKFLKLKSAGEVLELIQQFEALEPEVAPLELACGRVVAAPVAAGENIPQFQRATMDGYAVRARDTFGASESFPALLEVSGSVAMGREAVMPVLPGKAVGIATGGMLPAGADAVVMVEYTQALDDQTIEVGRPVAPGDNVLQIGEDIASGAEVLQPGSRLRAQEIGVLAALGVTGVPVYRRPRVAIISTGDEIVPVATASLAPGKVRDINSYVLAAQVQEAGGLFSLQTIVTDDLPELAAACRTALADHDVVLLSGGSSVGVRDYTISLLEQLPDTELLVHGIAIRPGKPTILARVGGKIFWGLPGQPVSAMIVFTAFVRPFLARLQGERAAEFRTGQTRTATLNRQLPSVHGRADYLRVALSLQDGALLATPVFGKSAMISTLANADGYIVVPEHVEGFDQGSEVTVHLFEV